MFDSMLARARETNHRFTVYAENGVPPVEEWFPNHSVEVDYRALPADVPAPFLVVEHEDELAGVIPLATVDRLLEPPIVRPESHEGLSPAYSALFEVLEDTVYTSMSRDELAVISREIEDRAARVGEGTLYAGFQRFSRFRSEVTEYCHLAASGVSVHVYGVPDWEPPKLPGVTYTPIPDGPQSRYWVLAFDGGEDSSQSCGLIAREADAGDTGFLMDEAATVQEIRWRIESARE